MGIYFFSTSGFEEQHIITENSFYVTQSLLLSNSCMTSVLSVAKVMQDSFIVK
jgi:hypothetical protein